MSTKDRTVVRLADFEHLRVASPPTLPPLHTAKVVCFGCGRTARHIDEHLGLCQPCDPR